MRRARHHTNVMFRSSENNKNKTTVLLNNNPMPDYSDREGVLPITRYATGKQGQISGRICVGNSLIVAVVDITRAPGVGVTGR